MIDVFGSLGIERIRDDKDLFERLNEKISSDVQYVIPGYSRDYYLKTFPREVEFEQCRLPDGSVLGTDIHFSGSDLITLDLEEVISDEQTTHCYRVRNGSYPESFCVRVVCPDVVARAKPGDAIFGQIVAFPGKTVRFASRREIAGGFVFDCGDGNVRIAGKIVSVAEYRFEFEDVSAELYELEVSTPIGKVAVIAPKSRIGPPTAGMRLVCEAVLSVDVAVIPRGRPRPDYRDAPFIKELEPGLGLGCGFIPDPDNALKLFAGCVEKKDFSRFPRACGERITVYRGGAAAVVEYGEIERALSALFPGKLYGCEIVQILSGPSEEAAGRRAVLVLEDGEPSSAAVAGVSGSGFVNELRFFDPKDCQFGFDRELLALAELGDLLRLEGPGARWYRLTDDCVFRSELSGRTALGAGPVSDALAEEAEEMRGGGSLGFRIVPAREVLRISEDLPELYRVKWCAGLRRKSGLSGYVFIKVRESGMISRILISRNSSLLKDFYDPERLPRLEEPTLSVKSLLEESFGSSGTLAAVRDKMTGEDEKGAYVWKEADGFMLSLLEEKGYTVTDSFPTEDSIAYACVRKGKEYAVYMYACGKKRYRWFDDSFCRRLRSRPLSANRTILIVYLRVLAQTDENGGRRYRVGKYGDAGPSPEFWTIQNVNGRDLILYYPGPEIFGMSRRFAAAYNAGDRELLRAICARDARYIDFNGYESPFFGSFRDPRYTGKMKIAYVRFNDLVYSAVPCFEGLCYFVIRATNETNLILSVSEKPLDGYYSDLIVTEEIPVSDPGNDHPLIREIRPDPTDGKAACALRLLFDNGETRRYEFNVTRSDIRNGGEGAGSDDGIFEIDRVSFTERIFAHGRIVDDGDGGADLYGGFYPGRGQGVGFMNGYWVSTAELYFKSRPVS